MGCFYSKLHKASKVCHCFSPVGDCFTRPCLIAPAVQGQVTGWRMLTSTLALDSGVRANIVIFRIVPYLFFLVLYIQLKKQEYSLGESMDDKTNLEIFINSLKPFTKISFALFNGTLISGSFATPKPHPDYIGSDPYEDRVVLESATVWSGKFIAKVPKVIVHFDEIVSWVLIEQRLPLQ
jgi:hypothetical protein